MMSWQDEPNGSPFSRGGGDPSGRPTSRRAAREAERRAAETMLEKPPHPSGVVDFEAHDFSSEFTPDQDFSVGDTQDIWRALTRGAQPGAVQQPDVSAFRGGVPETRAPEPGTMPETMDRVREALLRRRAQPEPTEQTARLPQQRPSAFDSQSFDPGLFDAREPAAEQGVSRRERRRRETADLREDGLPTELFDGRAVPAQRFETLPADYDEYADYERQAHQVAYDDAYYDAPYAPEPTISIPVRGAQLPAPRPATAPIALPQGWAEPAGDDALTFSSPVPHVQAGPHELYADADADPEFIEPEPTWQSGAQSTFTQPRPASGPVSFLEPLEPQQRSTFREAQIGPPSELTDLAGFEALIRKARQQPSTPQPAAAVEPQPAPLAWADEEEVQEGFGSLLSRQVQSSHGTSPALILPNDPQPVDLTQAVSGTGDIYVTGTMKLSSRFSSTGVSEEHYDSHEIDRLYDASQDEPAAGVAPVRASKAVSGASQNRVVSGKPGRGNLLPTVLAIVAGAMAVGVVTLLVGSWVFKIF